MFKKLFEPVDKNIRLSLLLALIYCILFNSSVLILKFDYYKANLAKGLIELFKDSLYILLINFIIFFGLSVSRITYILGSLFLFASGAIASYTLYFFKIAPTKQMLKAMFESGIYEMNETVSFKLISWIILSLILCAVIFWYKKVRCKGLNIASFICFIVFCSNIVSPHYKILTQYFPMQYLHNAYLYFYEKSNAPQKIDISNIYQFSDLSDDDIVGVLVIGESARYDHFSLNGYVRNTTPLISKIPNLFSFKANACANITYNSVPCMLSRFTGKEVDRAMEETSFLSVLTKLEFNTDWIGTQSLLQYFKGAGSNTVYDEVNMAILPGGSALYQMNDHDEVMLPYFENILTKQGKKFIVLHTSGSHWNYAARHPENYKIFTPTCSNKSKIDQSSCTIEQLINSYDNSILYTDYILDQIIKLLADKNAFMIYVSDHGESLGEDGVFAHGSHMTLEQTTVPLIFWGSSSFIEHHPELLNNLTKRKSQELSHDNIFHSVLDCVGIDGEIIDKNMSLCR